MNPFKMKISILSILLIFSSPLHGDDALKIVERFITNINSNVAPPIEILNCDAMMIFLEKFPGNENDERISNLLLIKKHEFIPKSLNGKFLLMISQVNDFDKIFINGTSIKKNGKVSGKYVLAVLWGDPKISILFRIENDNQGKQKIDLSSTLMPSGDIFLKSVIDYKK